MLETSTLVTTSQDLGDDDFESKKLKNSDCNFFSTLFFFPYTIIVGLKFTIELAIYLSTTLIYW